MNPRLWHSKPLRNTEHEDSQDWVAVKELDLSCHNGDIWQIIGFWDYGNLS